MLEALEVLELEVLKVLEVLEVLKVLEVLEALEVLEVLELLEVLEGCGAISTEPDCSATRYVGSGHCATCGASEKKRRFTLMPATFTVHPPSGVAWRGGACSLSQARNWAKRGRGTERQCGTNCLRHEPQFGSVQ